MAQSTRNRFTLAAWSLALSLCSLPLARADEAPQPLWSVRGGGTQGDEADGVAIDTQGAVIATGVFEGTATIGGRRLTSRGQGDVFVAKYAADGGPEWVQAFGSGGEDNAFDLCSDPQDSVILSGWFARTLRLGSFVLRSRGGQDAFLAKLDARGRVLWALSYGGAEDDGGNEVTVDGTGAILVSATSAGDLEVEGRSFRGGGGRDAYVLKFAPGGQLEWAKQLGGAGEARVRAIAADGFGRVHAGFQFTGQATLGRRGRRTTFSSRGSWDGLLVTWSTTGQREAELQLGGTGYDMVRGVGGDDQGRVYVSGAFAGRCTLAGRTLTSKSSQDDYLLKLDRGGRSEWIVQFSGGAEDGGTYGGAEIVVTAAGDAYLSTKVAAAAPTLVEGPRGSSRIRTTARDRAACLLAFSPEGELRWSRQPDASDYSTSGALDVSPDGKRVVQVISFRGQLEAAGEAYRTSSRRDKDFALSLVPTDGTPAWQGFVLPPKPDWRVRKDVAYRAGVAPRGEVSLDLYAPAARAPRRGYPILAMVHGGGWTTGDKGNRKVWEAKARHYVARGWIFASLNYRLAPGVAHPTQAEDVAAALAFLHDQAASLGGDPRRLFAMGHSAGAHLVALVATDEAHLRRAGKSPRILSGVVCLDTSAYDIPRSVELSGPGKASLYEVPFGPRRNWPQASPEVHVAAGKPIPPFFLIHAGRGRASRVVTREFAATLSGAGVSASVLAAPDRDHEGINRCIGTVGDPYTREIDAFLAR